MDRQTELGLLGELLGLEGETSAFLAPTVTTSDVSIYEDPAHFARERRTILRVFPQIALHARELPEAGSFRVMDIAGLPVLLTRDREGEVHAMLNVCRHRGARLVDAAEGCKHSFSCPYHAWSYGSDGALRGVPHQKQGFPGLDKSAMGLQRLPVMERFGWIWVVPRPGEYYDFDSFLDPIAPDLSWVGAEHMQVMQSDEILCRANWKTIVEGGIEAYHFKVAHADTIGPHFLDNLSTYQMFGPHMRSVLARTSLPRLRELPRDEWDIRADTNILYSLFPIDQLLLMEDHLAWVHLAPLSAGETLIRLSTVAPRDGMPGREAHWARNHRITCTTLTEDFVIAEGVQAGISSGANDVLTFGRYEGALHSFAQQVAAALSTA